MRVSRQKAMAENRQRIVDAASRPAPADEGFDGVGVDAIMKEAELTHGGFYGHFASKDALMAEAMAHAVERSTAWQERLENLSELVTGYPVGPPSRRPGQRLRRGGARRRCGSAEARAAQGNHRGHTPAARPHRLPAEARHLGSPPAPRHPRPTPAWSAHYLARAVDDAALAREILTAASGRFQQRNVPGQHASFAGRPSVSTLGPANRRRSDQGWRAAALAAALFAITLNFLQPLAHAALMRSGAPGNWAAMCLPSMQQAGAQQGDEQRPAKAGTSHECCLGLAHAATLAEPSTTFVAIDRPGSELSVRSRRPRR